MTGDSSSSSFFSLGRTEGFPSQYGEQHTPAHLDVVTTGILLCLGIVVASFFSILPAYGKQRRKSLFLRVLSSLLIGGIVIYGNYGHNWEIAKVKVISPYKPYSHEEISATLGLHIMLRGINVTLKGEPVKHHNEKSELLHERIDYNEHFSWEWAQGRLGFGYYAGQFNKDFRTAQLKGVPIPILQVAEYFTFDGEGIRFGRYYRLAAWYTHIFMWTALGTWILTNILFTMIVSTATYFLILTGLLQLSAISIWTFHRNPIEIQIPFQSAADPQKEILMKTTFGLDYYLVLVNGIFAILLGIVLLILNTIYPDEMCSFFGIDPLTIYDEFVLSKDEIQTASFLLGPVGGVSTTPEPMMMTREVGKKTVSFDGDQEGGQGPDYDVETDGTLMLKRRTNMGSTLFRKSFKMKPKPKPRRVHNRDENEIESQGLLREMPQEQRSDDEDDRESYFSWPPPPRESQLKLPKLPPTPPPKRKR